MIRDMSSSEAVTSRVACMTQSAETSDQMTSPYIVWVPCDSTHAPPPSNSHPASNGAAQHTRSTTICQGNDLTFSTKVPYDRVPGIACASKNVLHLLVPSDRRNLIELRAAIAQRRRVGFRRVVEIPYINLFVYTNT